MRRVRSSRFAALLVAACASAALCGCVGQPLDRQVFDSADRFASLVGPEYLRYVQNDSTLDASGKQVRLDRVTTHRAVLDTYKSKVLAPAPTKPATPPQ